MTVFVPDTVPDVEGDVRESVRVSLWAKSDTSLAPEAANGPSAGVGTVNVLCPIRVIT